MRSMLAAALALLISHAARAEDTAAPVVEHAPVTSTASGAKAVQVFAKITDESKFFPQIFFRYGAGPYEKPVDMKPVKGSKNQFGGNVPIKGDSVEYYVEAYDEYGNGPGRAGDPDHPFKVDTSGGQAVAKAAPPPKPAAEAPPPVRRTEPAVVVQQSGGRTWTWITGGVGLGLLAGGLVGGLAVKTADTAYNHRLAAQGNDAATLQEQYDANKSLGTKATILTIAGGVLLAGSVALYFLEAPPPSDDRGRPARKDSGGSGLQGSLVPLQGGGALALQGSF